MPPMDVYTDGASKGNPGPAGWAFVIGDELHSGSLECQTNNYAELYAIFQAVAHAQPASSIRILTDSMCCINWLTGRWRCHQPQAAKLLELIHFLKEAKDLHCTIKHIRGHSGDPGNERADGAASLEAAQLRARQEG